MNEQATVPSGIRISFENAEVVVEVTQGQHVVKVSMLPRFARRLAICMLQNADLCEGWDWDKLKSSVAAASR